MSCNVGAIIRGSSRAVITAQQLSVRHYMAVSRDTCYCLAHLTAPNKSTLSVMAKSKRASSGKLLRLFSLLVSLSFFTFIYMFVTTNKPTSSIKHSNSSESRSFSSSQEIFILRKLEFSLPYSKQPPPLPVPSQLHPIHGPIQFLQGSFRYDSLK